MSPAQHQHYLALWGEVRKALRRQGVAAKDCDARRHEITEEALGYRCSSKTFSNAQFDKVKARLLALSRPEMLAPQLTALNQPRIRRQWKIADLCRTLGQDATYAEGIAARMAREGNLPSADLESLGERDLETVIIALQLQIERECVRRCAELAFVWNHLGRAVWTARGVWNLMNEATKEPRRPRRALVVRRSGAVSQLVEAGNPF